MLVTSHFSVEEFAQPARRGLLALPYPLEWVEGRMRPLCEVLEVLRRRLGDRPVTVLSGYRSEAYNRAVGGAPLAARGGTGRRPGGRPTRSTRRRSTSTVAARSASADSGATPSSPTWTSDPARGWRGGAAAGRDGSDGRCVVARGSRKCEARPPRRWEAPLSRGRLLPSDAIVAALARKSHVPAARRSL